MSKLVLPDLTRAGKALGEVSRDFDFYHTLRFRNDVPKRLRDLFGDIFLGYYKIEDAQYRRDFLGEWVDNEKTRKELLKIRRLLPHEEIKDVRTTGAWGEELTDAFIRSQISLVRKFLSMPETLEVIAEFSGTSDASTDLKRFARRARSALEGYNQDIRLLKESPQFKDKQSLDVDWANSCVEKVEPFKYLLDEIRRVRSKLNYYMFMGLPYNGLFGGIKMPFCKPEFLDPDQNEGTIIKAYNPRYFKFDRPKEKGALANIIRLSVPNNIHWGEDARGTFVGGTNNMGKSVYLDTVALNIHLAMNGAYCFADSCSLSLPGRLFPCFDIKHTLGQGHFYAGASRVDNMLRHINRGDIVFFDEVASGTEPDAERKIAQGIINSFLHHELTFFYAGHESSLWKKNFKRPRVRVLKVADYDQPRKRGKVWEGMPSSEYGMMIAKKSGIDPESVMRRLSERLEI